ncbi:MAG TPA: hypothetical protein VKB75_11615 [Jatrophihabitans sp.]|nr:hypothetical protein [Jatrophihabitans sp.]
MPDEELPQPTRRRFRAAQGSARSGLVALAAVLLAMIVGTAVVLAVRDSNSAQRLNTHPTPGKPPVDTSTPPPANMALVAYTSCDSLLAGLRGHTAAQVGPYGLAGGSIDYGVASGAVCHSTRGRHGSHRTT